MNNQIMYKNYQSEEKSKNISQKKREGDKKSQEKNIYIYRLKGTLKKGPKTHKKRTKYKTHEKHI